MKGKYLRRLLTGLMAVLLLPGIVTLLSSSTAEAQRRIIVVRRPIYRPFHRPWNWGWGQGWGYNPYFDYYSRYGHYIFDNSDEAFNRGYKDGLKTGQGDAKNRRSYSPERSHYHKEAGYGNFGEVYRHGFVRGYEAGFRS